jgi:hypothetical protein
MNNQVYNYDNPGTHMDTNNNTYDGFMNFNNNFSNINVRDTYGYNQQQNNFNNNDIGYGVSEMPRNNQPNKAVNNDPKKAIDDIFNDLF